MAQPGSRGSGRLAPAPGEDCARVFFALWPDAAARTVLGELARAVQAECGGRVAPAGNIHLTLVFLGDVAIARIDDLRRVAEKISAPRFDLGMDTVNYWRHNRIAWSGPRLCPDALRRLVAGLETALEESEFHFDRRPYVPHITLVRNARRAPAQQTPAMVRWPVTGFALVQSLRRSRKAAYEVLQHWSLGT